MISLSLFEFQVRPFILWLMRHFHFFSRFFQFQSWIDMCKLYIVYTIWTHATFGFEMFKVEPNNYFRLVRFLFHCSSIWLIFSIVLYKLEAQRSFHLNESTWKNNAWIVSVFLFFFFQRKEYVKYSKVFPLSEVFDIKIPSKWYRRVVGGLEVGSGIAMALIPNRKLAAILFLFDSDC